MRIKNKDVVKLVKEFGEVYEKYWKLKDEIEKELGVYSFEENWSKESEEKYREDEDYGMRLYVMKENLDLKD